MSDPTEILNWRRLAERITTSGQPSEAQLAVIAATGVTHVVNLGLHSHEKALPDEAATVAGLGMTYVHIPVDFAAPNQDDFDRFRATLDGLGDAKVHVHCIVNARVTAFFYRREHEAGGREDPAARAVMESVWQPGGVWASFIGDDTSVDRPHRYAGRDY